MRGGLGVRRRLVLLLSLAAGLLSCLPAAAAADAVPAALETETDRGGLLGDATRSSYAAPADRFLILREPSDHLTVDVQRDGRPEWSLTFAAPGGAPLAPGVYADASGLGSNRPDQPGLSIAARSSGCEPLVGSFTIAAIVWHPPATPEVLDVSFEARCAGSNAGVRGALRYGLAGRPTLPVAHPVLASFQVAGDPADPVTGGRSFGYETSAATFQLLPQPNGGLSVSILPAADLPWAVVLAAPAGRPLVPGRYDGATRWPFNRPEEPGLSVTGRGVGCNTSTGSFVVRSISWREGRQPEALDATFEQRCDGAAGVLRGEVRFGLPPPPPPPPAVVPPLVTRLGVAAQGRLVHGAALVHGRIACRVATRLRLRVTLRRGGREHRVVVALRCGVTRRPWRARVALPAAERRPGRVRLVVSAGDPRRGRVVRAVVRLARVG